MSELTTLREDADWLLAQLDEARAEIERLKADIARLTAERDQAAKVEPPIYTFQGFTCAVPTLENTP